MADQFGSGSVFVEPRGSIIFCIYLSQQSIIMDHVHTISRYFLWFWAWMDLLFGDGGNKEFLNSTYCRMLLCSSHIYIAYGRWPLKCVDDLRIHQGCTRDSPGIQVTNQRMITHSRRFSPFLTTQLSGRAVSNGETTQFQQLQTLNFSHSLAY